jgi:hypothetical protein
MALTFSSAPTQPPKGEERSGILLAELSLSFDTCGSDNHCQQKHAHRLKQISLCHGLSPPFGRVGLLLINEAKSFCKLRNIFLRLHLSAIIKENGG